MTANHIEVGSTRIEYMHADFNWWISYDPEANQKWNVNIIMDDLNDLSSVTIPWPLWETMVKQIADKQSQLP